MKEADVREIVSKTLENLPPKMTLQKAVLLIEKVQIKASEMGVSAVIAVSGDGARPIAVHCMDSAYIASYDVAVQKAFTVVALKMPTTELKELAAPGGSLYGIQYTNQGQIVIFGGGEPLYYGKTLIGGLGVSGGTEEQDSALAAYGAQCLEEVMSCR